MPYGYVSFSFRYSYVNLDILVVSLHLAIVSSILSSMNLIVTIFVDPYYDFIIYFKFFLLSLIIAYNMLYIDSIYITFFFNPYFKIWILKSGKNFQRRSLYNLEMNIQLACRSKYKI